MPTYTIKDPQSGRTLKLTGDSPPTEKELDEIFAAEAPANVSTDPYQQTARAPGPQKLGPQFANEAELEAAKQRQATEDVESFGSKAKMATRALGSATAKVGLPAAAVALSPFTGGASLAAVGGLSAMGGEYLGNQIAGEETTAGGLFQAGILGATPMRSLPSATALQTAGTALKVGTSGALGEAGRIALDEQRTPTASELAVPFGVGALAGPAIGKTMDSGRGALAAQKAASQDSVRRETLNAGRQLGLVVPPSAINRTNPSAASDTLESLAGKAATAQAAIERNQPKINAAIRSDIGLPDSAPLSEIAINTQRVAPNLVYDKIAKSSPEANNLLGQFKASNDKARELFAAYNQGKMMGLPNNATLTEARIAAADADTFKGQLSKVLPKSLFEEFENARLRLAKVGLAERAVRLGDGNVDPQVYAQALDSGEKLTGNARTIGRFANAFERYMKEAAKTPPSGVDHLKFLTKGALFGTGAATGNPALALGAPLAMAGAERGSRAAILSPFYQNRFAQPNYGNTSEDIVASLGRLGALQAARPE